MENKIDSGKVAEKALEQAVGGTGDGNGGPEGYYCPNKSCYMYGGPADDMRGLRCEVCGTDLKYGKFPPIH